MFEVPCFDQLEQADFLVESCLKFVAFGRHVGRVDAGELQGRENVLFLEALRAGRGIVKQNGAHAPSTDGKRPGSNLCRMICGRRYAAPRKGSPPFGGGIGAPWAAYSLSLLRKVRTEMPKVLAAWVRLLRQCLSVSRMRSRSTSATVRRERPHMSKSRGATIGIETVAVGREDRVGIDLWPVREQHRTMQRIIQFSYITAPGIAVERAARFRRQRPERHAVHRGVFLDEILCELGDVRRPLAQRRDIQIHHAEAEQKVF